jgi:hypothetical protein
MAERLIIRQPENDSAVIFVVLCGAEMRAQSSFRVIVMRCDARKGGHCIDL